MLWISISAPVKIYKATSVTAKGAAALKAAKPAIKAFYGLWSGKSANYRNN